LTPQSPVRVCRLADRPGASRTPVGQLSVPFRGRAPYGFRQFSRVSREMLIVAPKEASAGPFCGVVYAFLWSANPAVGAGGWRRERPLPKRERAKARRRDKNETKLVPISVSLVSIVSIVSG